MECPYCKREMTEGYIRSFRSEPEWFPGPADRAPLSEPAGVRLADPDIFASKTVPSWLCGDCRILITPIREYETTWNKLSAKWKRFTEHVAGDKEEQPRMDRKEEDTRAEKKRRDKDPWEV